MQRIKVTHNDVFIDNKNENVDKSEEYKTSMLFSDSTPIIRIYENDKLLYSFKIETLITNPDLTGQFFHCSIRIMSNSGVMIDGIVSKNEDAFSDWTSNEYEAIRLQPFFLSNQSENNIILHGKGLFERGLHFNGTITPEGVRNICICDHCNLSFTLQHFHAGLANLQYFYSTDSLETLIVAYGEIDNLPTQLDKNINENELKKIENKLPIPSNRKGNFKYYNDLKCPHCKSNYINFNKNKASRPFEYYGNTYINQKPKQYHN
jgi:hypothetical protein